MTSALLVGGGIGCAPLQYLADVLAARAPSVTAAFGFRDFRAARAAGAFAIERLLVATEDGASGGAAWSWTSSPSSTCRPQTVCTPAARGHDRCRPAWTLAEGLSGHASLEAHMACGTGSCHGCVVETARGQLRVCSEGPVFALDEVQT